MSLNGRTGDYSKTLRMLFYKDNLKIKPMNSKYYLLLFIVISIKATLCIAQTSNLNTIPKGTIEKILFKESKIYPGTERNITVYFPAQIDQSKPACVYVAQDGHKQHFTDVMDILIDRKEMPVTVGIFILPGTMPSLLASTGSRGNHGYEYNSLGDNYARFLLEDILPFIAKKYNLNLSEDGNDRCIGGLSSGGICAFNIDWERPDDFRRVYSNSGSFVAYCGGDIFQYSFVNVSPGQSAFFYTERRMIWTMPVEIFGSPI